MKNKFSLLLALAILTIFATSCGRSCHCYGFDGSHTYYTEDEVEEMYGSCSDMIYYGNGIYYSICEWDVE